MKHTYLIAYLITFICIQQANAQESAFKVPYPPEHPIYKRKPNTQTPRQFDLTKKYKVDGPPRLDPTLVPRSSVSPLSQNIKESVASKEKRLEKPILQNMRSLGDACSKDNKFPAAIRFYKLALETVQVGGKEQMEIIYHLIEAYHANKQPQEVLNLFYRNKDFLLGMLEDDSRQDLNKCINDCKNSDSKGIKPGP